MSEINLEIGAIFIADSHYNENRTELLDFLEELSAPQLVLMGDIFDFLCGEVDYWIQKNQKLIDLINKLSQTTQIIFLEGNHDYNLEKLFPEAIIVPRQRQPLIVNVNSKKYALSHGDIFTPFGYNLYTAIIRNSFFLQFVNFIDLDYTINKKIDSWLLKKNICSNIEDFESFAKKRLSLYAQYEVDAVVEGHFHQGKKYKNYINIPSYECCSQSYGIIDEQYQIIWKHYE